MQSIRFLIVLSFIFFIKIVDAQFPPPAGQPGTTAIYKDSSIFIAWATQCTVNIGYQNIANPSAGYASVGNNTSALGVAGTNGVVSLGDGGEAIIQFDRPIYNGQGWDFAVFENSFSDSFLELAFVEVSSDGINYFRFPSVSNTQTTLQIGAFDTLDATKIHNLAGKYRALYGTPFDLDELDNIAGLDINNITHIKIIDVVGSIQSAYARYDSNNNIINDPWPTEFASSGFDLDAVGVIHQLPLNVNWYELDNKVQFYPNPLFKHQNLNFNFYSYYNEFVDVEILNLSGIKVFEKRIICAPLTWNLSAINIPESINPGIYFVRFKSKIQNITQKIIINE